jgi:hypothetical protein
MDKDGRRKNSPTRLRGLAGKWVGEAYDAAREPTNSKRERQSFYDMYNYFVDFNLPSRKQQGHDALHTERGRVEDFDTHYLALLQVVPPPAHVNMHVSSSSYDTHYLAVIHLSSSSSHDMHVSSSSYDTHYLAVIHLSSSSSPDMHVSSSSYDTHYLALIQWRYVGLMLSEFVGASYASKLACPAILVPSVEGGWEDKEMAGVRGEYWPTWGHPGNEF